MTLPRNVRLHVISSVIILALVMMTAVSMPLRAQNGPRAGAPKVSDTVPKITTTDVHFHKYVPPVAPGTASPSATPNTQAEINAFVAQQIDLLEQEKAARTPAQQKIDSNVLYTIRMMKGQTPAPGITSLYTGIELDDNNNIAVDMMANVTPDLLQRLQAAGALILDSQPNFRAIRAIIPPNQIEGIAALSDVTFIGRKMGSVNGHIRRAPDGSALERWRKVPGFAQKEARVRKMVSALLQKPNAILTGSGSVDTEGDITHRAFDARGTFGVTGAGLKIGVLSDSANATGAVTSAQATGDLPPTCPGPGGPCLTIVQDFPDGDDEGAAMMEIIYDLAPGASLFFATADNGEASFATNIMNLRSVSNCDIIVDDVFYFDEPVFQDGQVAQAVVSVVTAGALYFSSAGNEGNLDSQALGFAGYFEGDFNSTGSPAFTQDSGKTGTVHNFGTVGSPLIGNVIQFSGEAYTLNWADPFPTPLNPSLGSSNDYDLFYLNSGGTVIASSTNPQTGTQPPFEIIGPPTLNAGDQLVVFKTTAAATLAFSLNTIRGTLTEVTDGQTHGHSAVAITGEFSVGATPAAGACCAGASAGPFPNPFNTSNQVEPFTSDGPRQVFFNADGTAISPGKFTFASGGGTSRPKPDITAADGVMTTLPGNSGLNPFYGTSAAAPHAAAIAALVKSAMPTLTQAQITTTLESTALDIMAPGFDRDSGNGIVMAYQAVASLGIAGQADPQIASEVASQNPGNGDGNIKAGEGAKVVVQLQNKAGVLSATGITATLSTATPGVTVLLPNAMSYSDMAAGATSGGSNQFDFVLASNFSCATTIDFTLTVNYSGGQQRILGFSVPTGTINFTNNLGTTPTAITGFTTATGLQTNRIFRDGNPSICTFAKTFPGTVASGSETFDSYTFTPKTSGCVNSTLTTNTNTIFEAVYANGFVPSSIGTNYAGDAGESGGVTGCGISVVASTPYTFVISDVSGGSVGTPYTLSLPACTLFGTINQIPIAIAQNVTVVAATAGGSANVTANQVNNGSNDPDGDPIVLTLTPPGPYPHGVTNVILTATDAVGGASQATAMVTVVDPPDMTITKSHNGNFQQTQVGAIYTITATNSGGSATTAPVSVVDTLPASGLTATALAGTGWACTLATLTCTNSTVLAAGLGYSPITLTVTVAGNAPASVTNTAVVSGGGETNTANDTATDLTTITPALPDMTITKSHNGNFSQNQVGAMYTITATNSGLAPTTAAVNVVDTLPASLTATAMTGTGWVCTVATLTCTRSDVLAAGASYPAITLTVTVASNAPASVTNTAVVSGGGETNFANDTAMDATTITPTFPDMTITKSHVGNFTQGQAVGATYTITVSNVGVNSTNAAVSMVDTLPASLTATVLTGTGWTCTLGTLTCTRSDVLAAGASYPAITLTVTVAANAGASVTNTAVVSGGGETNFANDTANDVTTIVQLADMTIAKTHAGNFVQGQVGATYTITVSNSGNGATTAAVSMVDTLPASLTATALSGTGWACTVATLTCTRSDVLAAVSSYPAITLTVTVAANAPASVTNTAVVSGGGEIIVNNDTAANPTTILTSPMRARDLVGPGRIDADRERGQPILLRVSLAQGTKHGGRDVGTASDRFGKDDIGGMGAQCRGRIHKVRKAAAEAPAGDFGGIEAVLPGELGIHQRIALIVENDGRFETARGEFPGCSQDERGFPRAQESAHDRQPRTFRHARTSSRKSPPSPRVRGCSNSMRAMPLRTET